jgi:beta propeller repeat protein
VKAERTLALFIAVSVIFAGTGAAVPFADGGPFRIAHPNSVVSAPAADGDRILWIESTSAPYYAFLGCHAIHAYNTTSRTTTLIRSRATNARAPDLDGDLAVWEEERGTAIDIVLYNFRTGTVLALHTNGLQHNPRVSGNRIVWEEGFDGERGIVMYDTKTGDLLRLSAGKTDCFAPDIDGNTVVWVEHSDGDAYSIVSLDLVSGRRDILATNTAPVSPRIDGGRAVWEDGGSVLLASAQEGVTTLSSGTARRSGAVISETIVAWSEDGRIRCHDLADGQTTLIGRLQASTKPAILEEGIAWVEEVNGGVFSIQYQPFSSPPSSGLKVEPAATTMSRATGSQTGRLREGECAWYALDVSPGTTGVSLDFSWENSDDSLSCTLVGPGGALLRFTDGNDAIMDAAVRVSVTSPAGIAPGRWYCAVTGESIEEEEISYTITWYECDDRKG